MLRAGLKELEIKNNENVFPSKTKNQSRGHARDNNMTRFGLRVCVQELHIYVSVYARVANLCPTNKKGRTSI